MDQRNQNAPSRHYRVLHIITRLDSGGSAENTLLTVLKHNPDRYIPSILCGQSDIQASSNEQKVLQQGISITRVDWLVRNISPVKDVLALIKMIDFIRRGSFDIVHTHTSKAGIIGRIAAKIAGVRCIVHTPHGHIFYGYFPAVITGLFILLERMCTLFTDIQITLTRQEMRDYLQRKIGTESKTIQVFSGIELERYLNPAMTKNDIRNKMHIPQNAFVAGTVARLDPIKNHRLIIDAAPELAARIPQICFMFVGDGELAQSYRDHIKTLQLESHFILTGWRTDIADILVAFDIFIMCSKNEGQGRAFVEAQAAGLPVIGSRVGGVAEVIDEGTTGYLIDPSKSDELINSVEMLYNKRDRKEHMAQACRQWVNPQFSATAMVRKIESIYQDLIDRKREKLL